MKANNFLSNRFKALALTVMALAMLATGAKAQTTIYTSNFPNATGWTLSNTTWSSSHSGSLLFAAPGSTATSGAIIPAGYENLRITITAVYGDYIYLQTSPNGTTWSPTTSNSSGDVFTGDHTLRASTQKSMPNGTRYVRFYARSGTMNDVFLSAVTITGTAAGGGGSSSSDGSGSSSSVSAQTPVCTGTPDASWSSGTITTGDQLARFAQRVNSGTTYSGSTVILGNDIDISCYDSWTPIGTSANPFRGTFDGNGKKITGLKINNPSLDYAGLFGYVSWNSWGNSIKNFGVECESIVANNYVGCVAGYVVASAGVGGNGSSPTNPSGGCYNGTSGTVSNASGSIEIVYSNGNITGNNYVGGIVGYAESKGGTAGRGGNGVNNVSCAGGSGGNANSSISIAGGYSTANVDGTNYVGGIVGYIKSVGGNGGSGGSGAASCGSYNWCSGGPGGDATASSTVYSIYSTGIVNGSAGYVGGVLGSFYVQNGTLGTVGTSGTGSSCDNGNWCRGGSRGSVQGSASLSNSAALNQKVSAPANVSKLIGWWDTGSLSYSSNVAFSEMRNASDNTTWSYPYYYNGTDITSAAIYSDNTIGSRFTSPTWTLQNGKLPTLFGEEIPPSLVTYFLDLEHLRNIIETHDFGWFNIDEINTQVAAREEIQSVINGLALNGATATVTDVSFTAANAAQGTNGKYTFTVLLEKEPAYPLTTAEISVEIQVMEFAEGTGTSDDPYIIRTKGELKLLALLTNSGMLEAGKYFKMANDIDLESEEWVPIGTEANPFRGNFDGGGFEVKNLKIANATVPHVGLFGKAENATFVNLGICENSSIVMTFPSDGNTQTYTGGIVGLAQGTGSITNCWNKANIQNTVTTVEAAFHIGGVAGRATDVMECFNEGDIDSRASTGGNAPRMGGVVGTANSVTNSYNRGAISANKNNAHIGGVVGQAINGISNSYNTGGVTNGVSAGRMGLIAGNENTVITNCYYHNSVSTTNTTTAHNGIARSEAQFTAASFVAELNGSPSSHTWVQDPAVNDGYPIHNKGTVTVTFNTNSGNPIADATFQQKQTYASLPTPVRAGYIFDQWYLDPAFTQPVTATHAIGNENKTVYARWKATTEFVVAGGTAVSPIDYFTDQAYLSTGNSGLPTPTRAGYTFGGWVSEGKTLVDNSNTVTAPTTLYATWEVNVKFNAMGGSDVAPMVFLSSVDYGSSPNEGLPTPTKDGYVFGSWHSSPILSELRSSSDIAPFVPFDTLYAQWGNFITVQFDPRNGDQVIEQQYFPNRAYNATFTSEGVTFNTGFPPNPTMDNAEFLGWYADDQAYSQTLAGNTVPNESHTLVARWNTKITVSFETNGAAPIEPREYFPTYAYNAGGNPSFPTNPTLDGAYFLGWYSSPDFSGYQITASTIVASNVTTLYARWSTPIKVYFYSNGVSLGDRDYYPGYTYSYSNPSNAGLLANPTLAGSHFMGWYSSPDFSGIPITNSTTVDQNVTAIYARWSTQFTVSFETYGGTTIADRNYYPGYAYNLTPNNTVGFPANPTLAGHHFAGWYSSPDFSGTPITASTIVDPNIATLYAKWATQFTVSFETNGGTTIADRNYYPGYAYNVSPNPSLPANPTLAGNYFAGWYSSPDFSGLPIIASDIVDQNIIVLYAKWVTQFAVSFETYGGTAIADRNYYPGIAYNASSNSSTGFPANPTLAGNYFAGWYATPDFSGLPITATSIVDPNVTTLYAKWIPQITVSFETDGGTAIANRNYYPGYAYNVSPNPSLPVNPTKANYHFLGWYATSDFSGSPIIASTIVDPNIEILYARWAEKTTVTFIDYMNDVSVNKEFWSHIAYNASPNTGFPAVSSLTTSPSSPNVVWYSKISGLEEKQDNNSPAPDKHSTLFALWLVEVNFEANGGTAVASRTYVPGARYGVSPNTGLPTSTRAGYGFGGWHSDAALTQPITATSIVYDGAHTLYAKWQLGVYTVTFVDYDGTVLKTQANVSQGSAATAPPNPTRAGYAFTGWDVPFSNITSDLTVTAMYEEVTSSGEKPVALPQISAANSAMQIHNGINLLVATGAELRIYDMKGRILQAPMSYSSGAHNVSLGHLPKGMYIVSVKFGNQSIGAQTEKKTMRVLVR